MLGKIGLFLLISATCFASVGGYMPGDGTREKECPPPWFTGPLLTPSGHVVPLDYINAEPYWFYTVTTGRYDSDGDSFSTPNFTSNNFQLPLFVGLTEWMNILLIGQAEWNETMGVSSLEFADTIVELDFQLLHDTRHNTLPGIKFYVQERFPTGRFEKRDPDKLGTDISGLGSFMTSIGFVITRTFELRNCHFFSWRANPFFVLPAKIDVQGINTYGGALNTNARIKPGIRFGGLMGIEYNFNRNWAFAMDLQAIYENKVTFKGFPGTNADGTPATLGNPSNFQFSIAPALEYNFNAQVGVIGGIWFSLAGRNSPRFISGAIAINYFGPLTYKTVEEKHRFRRTGGGSSPSGAGGGGSR